MQGWAYRWVKCEVPMLQNVGIKLTSNKRLKSLRNKNSRWMPIWTKSLSIDAKKNTKALEIGKVKGRWLAYS